MSVPDASSPRRRERLTAGLAACATGVGLWLASPAVGLSVLAWVAIVPVACVVLADGARAGARWAVPAAYLVWLELELIPALAPGIAAGQWGDPVVPLVADSPAVPVALVAVPVYALLLALVGFGRPWPLARLRARLAGIAAVLVPAVAWTAAEVVEIRVVPGGWSGSLFATQEDAAPAGLTALGGPYLVTFAVVSVNYAVAWAVVRRSAGAALGATAAVGAVALAAALAPVRDAGARGDRLVVAAVQPGYDTAEEVPATRAFVSDRRQAAADIIDDLRPLTLRAARAGARLVVWPEAVVWVDPARTPSVRRRLTLVAREARAAIVVSYFEPGPKRSSVLVVRDDGSLSAPVPKQRPMWYLGERGRTAGPARSLAAAGTRIGTTPGADNEDLDVARRLVDHGARVLTATTHDWEQLAARQRTFASLTAVATGVPLVRADWRYGSGIWAADGTRLAGSGTARSRTVLTAEIAPGRPTPYVRSGDALGDAALVAALLAGVAGLVMSRRERRRGRTRDDQPA